MGVLIGVALSIMFVHHRHLLEGFIVILIFFAVYTRLFAYYIYVFFFTMLLILILGFGGANPWTFAFYRIIDTGIGACIALVTSIFLFPEWAREDFYTTIINAIKDSHKLFGAIMNYMLNNQQPEPDFITQAVDIENLLTIQRQRFDDYTHEPSSMVIADGSASSITTAQERMHSVLLSFIVLIQNDVRALMNDELKTALTDFCKQTDTLVQQLIEATTNNSPLPELDHIDHALTTISSCVKAHDPEHINIMLHLLFHNCYAYLSEIKHIKQAIAQLRAKG